MSANAWRLAIQRASISSRACTAIAVASLAVHAAAQSLPIRHYDVSDGLANSRTNAFFQDSRGYLWIGTWEGVSRFDGLQFESYGTLDGLPNPLVNAIAEDARGRMWIGAQGDGLARLLDDPSEREPTAAEARPRLFERHRLSSDPGADQINVLRVDRAGNLWCGTNSGLFRVTRAALDGPADRWSADLVIPEVEFGWSQLSLEDGDGRLWFGAGARLYEIDEDRVIPHDVPDVPDDRGAAVALCALSDGRIRVAFDRAVLDFDPRGGATGRSSWSPLPIALTSKQKIRAMQVDARDTLWVGTTAGLIQWTRSGQRTLSMPSGLSDDSIRALLCDRDDNLWIGTLSGGVCRLSSDSIVSWTTAHGLPNRNVFRLVEDQTGHMFGTTSAGVVEIREAQVALVPGSTSAPFDRVNASILQDRRGDWWIGTPEGLFRFDGPALQFEHGRRFSSDDGIEIAPCFGRIYEDPSGAIWAATEDAQLFVWDPARHGDVHFDAVDLEAHGLGPPREMWTDTCGALWLAPYNKLARRARDGSIRIETLIEGDEPLPRCLYQDRRQRLWIGTRFQGVAMTNDPCAEHPTYARYTTRTGLASDAVWAITEDTAGRMYFATGRGLDQLDPASGHVRHFDTSAGLAGDIVYHCITGRDGAIWVATSGGISRIDPRDEEASPVAATVYIAQVQVAGRELPIASTGAREVAEVTLPAAQNNLLIEFRGLCFRDERSLAYQHRLRGENDPWSSPSSQRSVNFAELGPGDYRFEVRGVRSGAPVGPSAVFAFHILPPLWRRGWFLVLAGAVVVGGALSVHRARVARLLALESIRRQIATDIHDDLGSGLAQIAILSEVAKRQGQDAARSHMDEIARLARGMRESMSDIVWSIDPRKDHFTDLVQRMRQVTFNLLESEGMTVEFDAPAEDVVANLVLGPDKRRHLLLMFKELVSNIARHAHAKNVRARMTLGGDELVMSVEDDGCGFDAETRDAGHGLSGLKLRAELLGGRLTMESKRGVGTKAVVTVPM